MKTIGLIGGLSWHSSLEYYRIINEVVGARLGGGHSARCVLYSLDYAEIDALERAGRIADTGPMVADAAQRLERAGADFAVICSNTTHLLAEAVQTQVRIPLLHIADATGQAVRAGGWQRVGLLGTHFTMEQDFIRGRLALDYGLEVIVPEAADRAFVDAAIYDELCLGAFDDTTRGGFHAVIGRLQAAGAEAVVLGCTEIGLLVRAEEVDVPLLDTLRVHAEAAADFALAG